MSGHLGRARAFGLLAAAALFAGASEARAGIVVSDTTIMPTGDPQSVFDFKIALGTNTLMLQGDFLTLMDVPDFDGTASYLFKVGNVDYAPFFSILSSAGTAAGLTNIELLFIAPSPASLYNPSPTVSLPIGDLLVETSDQFPPSPDSPLLKPIHYITLSHENGSSVPSPGGGLTPIPTVLTPEPASLALVGLGLASAGLLGRRRRSPA